MPVITLGVGCGCFACRMCGEGRVANPNSGVLDTCSTDLCLCPLGSRRCSAAAAAAVQRRLLLLLLLLLL